MADLASYMGDIARRREEFELLPPVVFNCVCFRVKGLDEAGNRAVLKRLVDGGTAFLGPASVKGRLGLRACFMNLRTTQADVDLIMDEIARLGRETDGEVEPRSVSPVIARLTSPAGPPRACR
jgi:aromatic-L-amino-acid/L-tryptophan decarboxylase